MSISPFVIDTRSLPHTSANDPSQSAISRHHKPHVPEHQYRDPSAKRRPFCPHIAHRKIEYRWRQPFEHAPTRSRTGPRATPVGRDSARRKHDRCCAERRTGRASSQGSAPRRAHTAAAQHASRKCQACAAGIRHTTKTWRGPRLEWH